MYSNTSPSQERELVLKLINDDENAFCELYSIYRNRLIYFAMRYLKSRDFAEDIFQDTFTIVWQSVSLLIWIHLFLHICTLSCETAF